VLSPRILSRSVNLHPVWVLLAIIAGGSLFGFIGMLIAVPAAAAIQVFVRHWVAAYKESAVYDPEADSASPAAGSDPQPPPPGLAGL
jgi:predicted PurR-regulated permease PerM